jgi:1-acyl-sn-glycerol-3-phosphate acyltransferase
VSGPGARGLSTLAGAAGWDVEGEIPTIPRFVCVGAPHTSNWDGVLLLALARGAGLDVSWMLKSDWFKGPMDPLLRRLGAVPIDRSHARDVVDTMIGEFARRERFVLVIAAEGTRSAAPRWRSGFYHIARGAGVPVVPAYLDYPRRRGGFGPPIHLTGDVRADMDRIRAFYAAGGYRGHRPEHVGPIRLREEE